MKLRVSILTCLLLLTSMLLLSNWVLAADEDSDKEKEEDQWGDYKIDHKLNIPWEYPNDYVKRPLVYNKRVTEFGVGLSYKDAKHYYDEDGNLVEGDFRIKKQTIDLSLGMGFTDRWSVRINFPFSYKKTKIDDPSLYRLDRSNVYGTQAEEAFIDFVDYHELWKLWEADLPSLGDVHIWTGYSLYQKFDPTTSFIIEFDYKAPTGNDNPRRGAKVRNYLTTGTPDFYSGLAIKQQTWKFSFEGHAGYNARMKSDTKYSSGTLDLSDQLLTDLEVAFQVPELKSVLGSWTILSQVHYMRRMTNTTITPNTGGKKEIEDTPGYSLSIEPKIIYPYKGFIETLSGELYFSADIPLGGQRSFLVQGKNYFLPPWEIESYEAVGITYTLGLIKRWQ